MVLRTRKRRSQSDPPLAEGACSYRAVREMLWNEELGVNSMLVTKAAGSYEYT